MLCLCQYRCIHAECVFVYEMYMWVQMHICWGTFVEIREQPCVWLLPSTLNTTIKIFVSDPPSGPSGEIPPQELSKWQHQDPSAGSHYRSCPWWWISFPASAYSSHEIPPQELSSVATLFSSSSKQLLSSSEIDRLSLGSTRLPPPASSTTLIAASLIVPGTAHVTSCKEEKKCNPTPATRLFYTHTHTHTFIHGNKWQLAKQAVH